MLVKLEDAYDYGINLNSESLLFTGAGSLQVVAKGSSYVEVQNTSPLEQFVGGIYTLDLDDYSTMNYYGGETGAFYIYEDASAVFEGGRIDYISSYQSIFGPNETIVKHIEMIVKTHDYNISTKILTGIWADDSAFNIQLVDKAGYDPAIDNIAFTIVPEPATLALLGLGMLALRRNRR